MRLLFCISADTFFLSSKVLDLKISGSISETYDDNLTYLEDNEKEDFVTLGLEAMNEKKRAINFIFDK